jgi:transcriptional regulator with XRE-family HTH domain
MLWFSHAARGSGRENPCKTLFTKCDVAFILLSKSVPADGGTMTVGKVIRQMREERGWSQAKLGVLSGTGPSGISQIETGRRNPSAATLERIAKALEVEVRDLFPLAQAPLLDVEEERRAVWEAAVDEARRLRETGWAQMWKALSEWRASKQRGEPYGTRRKYLDEMGNLLQDAYGAYLALGNAYIEAALTQGGSEASVPSYLREETQAANDFYVEIFGLVRSAGLSVLTGDDASAAKQATAEHAATEHAESETRPLRVEEPEAA